LRRTNDLLVSAEQQRSEDKEWIKRHPDELLTLLAPTNVSRHVAFQNPAVVRTALRIPRGGRTPDLTKLCKERVKVLLDLEQVKKDALKPRKEVRLEGILYGSIDPSCHTLDIHEAIRQGYSRIKMDVALPQGEGTTVYVFSIADDLETVALYRKIGNILHDSPAWGNVRNKSNRSDIGVMTGIGHRVNWKGQIEMYVTCQDNHELRDLVKELNGRLVTLFNERAPEFCQSIVRNLILTTIS